MSLDTTAYVRACDAGAGAGEGAMDDVKDALSLALVHRSQEVEEVRERATHD